jgi:hypothetical protein
MTMRDCSRSSRSRCPTLRPAPAESPSRIPIRLRAARLILAGVLGVSSALLVSCASSGTGLIPAQNAGPLQSDFDAVARAAESGNGSCVATEEAILRTEQDFDALPSTVDTGLRKRLRQGISALRADALSICKQPLALTTTTSKSSRTTTSTRTTPTAPVITQTTPTAPTAPATTPTTSGPGGGTPAPGAGGEVSPGTSEPGGTGASEGAARGGGGSGGARAGAGGQEGGR